VLYTDTGTVRDIKVSIYIYIYPILFNSTARYVEQSVWGTKTTAGQTKRGEKTEAVLFM
jgi:hypothetical protein